MRKDCLFCQIASGQVPVSTVYEDDRIVAFHDIHPMAPTHILVIPRQHIRNVADAKAADASLLGDLLLTAAKIARTEGVSDGFRLVTNSGARSGQSVYHLHIHLLGGRRMSWPPG